MVLSANLELLPLFQLREASRTTQDDAYASLVPGHGHTITHHALAQRKRMPVRHRRATAVRRRGPLLRERTALAPHRLCPRCRLRNSQNARRGVPAERAAELA
jgi:hypothetical protein